MSENKSKSQISLVFYLAALVVVFAGVMFASDIVTQFLMSVFVAVIASKPVRYLIKKGLPSGVAISLVLILVVILTSTLGGLIGASVARFSSNLDEYNQTISQATHGIFSFLETKGVTISRETISNTLDTGTIMSFTAKLLNGLGGMMGNMMMILLIVAFMLAETSSYEVKIKAIMNQPDSSMRNLTVAMEKINQYLGIKTITSLSTGVIIGLSLWLVGVDFPFMWGLIAFMMNYIPNIGSFIAAIPAIIMAFISAGLGGMIWTAVIFLIVNIVIGSILEPKIMGKDLGISTLVVLLSLIFWGWILGTTGMFLSIPLTLAAKIAFESHESTKWIAVLLGTEEDAKQIAPSTSS